mmetsp:Transcript_106909/g.324675  ORF Transcript_106909/g.324675 Transcript_106909/m.324675 type:complete len:82 (-) Transcript_106909:100-345(-)
MGPGLSKEDVAFLSAKLRCTVEEMLISKRAIREGRISKDMLESICRRAAKKHALGEGSKDFILALCRDVGVEVCTATGVNV